MRLAVPAVPIFDARSNRRRSYALALRRLRAAESRAEWGLVVALLVGFVAGFGVAAGVLP